MMAAQSITSSSIPNALDEAYSNEALPGFTLGRGESWTLIPTTAGTCSKVP